MNWPFHFALGFILALILFYFLSTSPYEIIVIAFFAGASALLPDLDHSASKARELLDKLIIFIAFIFTFLFYCKDFSCFLSEGFFVRSLAFAGAYFVVLAFMKPEHRGITHSLLFAALFCVMVYLVLGWKFALAGLLGYISHLLADREVKIV